MLSMKIEANTTMPLKLSEWPDNIKEEIYQAFLEALKKELETNLVVNDITENEVHDSDDSKVYEIMFL